MKVLLTGATGYIGKRLLITLVSEGHEVVCCVRDRARFTPPSSIAEHVEVIEVDFLDKSSLSSIPSDIDGAYYLMHSMSTSSNYEELELQSAQNFREAITPTNIEHVVYLSGIINEHSLSKHLASRKAVEDELEKGSYYFTTLRAGIIIGSGSASFEIVRDLVEKLPIMIAPIWLKTKSQPIGVGDVIQFLSKTLFNQQTYNQSFDIGGPDVLTYKDILLEYAKVRGLKRKIIVVPIMTPKLSSYWLYFVTSTSYKLASSLVSSMKIEVICKENNLNDLLNISPMNYRQALNRTLAKIDGHQTISSWKDSMISGRFNIKMSDFIKVPTHGCFVDTRMKKINNNQDSIERIWRIGGENGWYYGNWMWNIRGFIDKLWGGVGIRRGRTHPSKLAAGDAVDFWRVLYANKDEGRLLLYAEMKLPGEAWLELSLKESTLKQTATFRPKGLLGRMYWYAVLPFHGLVFNGLISALAK